MNGWRALPSWGQLTKRKKSYAKGFRFVAGRLMCSQPGGDASTSSFRKSRFDGGYGTIPRFWGVFEKISSTTNEETEISGTKT